MEETVVTLVVGVAGIAATLLVSAMGLYYTAQARVAPLRDALFTRQLDTAMQIGHLQSRIRVFATLMSGEGSPYALQARNDIADYYKQYCELEEKSAVIMPVEFWLELKGMSKQYCDVLEEFDEDGVVSAISLSKLESRMAKMALLCRALIGVDELSDNARSLFSGKKSYDHVVGMDVSVFEAAHARVNKS
ncbi:hypothetical protein ACIPM0_07330 [Pseudomonas sichuanensis]|uniref:hypothetical protein n=1 Tax=Pseudomonas sichuanensis TaxID=2213015 RepID=UPI00380839B7